MRNSITSSNYKTLGINGFTNKYYKILATKLVPILTSLYNDIYQHHNSVDLFLDSRIILLLKPNNELQRSSIGNNAKTLNSCQPFRIHFKFRKMGALMLHDPKNKRIGPQTSHSNGVTPYIPGNYYHQITHQAIPIQSYYNII